MKNMDADSSETQSIEIRRDWSEPKGFDKDEDYDYCYECEGYVIVSVDMIL